MTCAEKFLAGVNDRRDRASDHCSVCRSPVVLHESDEGTQSYERVVCRADVDRLVTMVERALSYCERNPSLALLKSDLDHLAEGCAE